MKGILIIQRLLGTLLLITLTIGFVRMVVIASQAEIGWETVRLQWQESTIGWLELTHQPLKRLEPSAQANYWLTEIQELQAAPQDEGRTAMEYMGAAWVLDSPADWFNRYHIRQSKHSHQSPRFGITIDCDSLKEANNAFEERCRDRCLKLAQMATNLEPEDVRWWRMYAVLQLDPELKSPRDKHWLATLDDCSRHDPKNALYDYLAALQLWSSSAEYDWLDNEDGSEGKYRLTIQNPKMFEQGVRRFNLAQGKPYVAVGEAGLPAVVHFLNVSRLPIVEQTDIAVNRRLAIRQSFLCSRLSRWLFIRTDDAEKMGATDRSLVLLKQRLRLFDQFSEPAESSAMGTQLKFASQRRYTLDSLVKKMKARDSAHNTEIIVELEEKERQTSIDSQVLASALADLEANRKAATNRMKFTGVLNWAALVSTLLLALVAICSAALRILLQKPDDTKFSFGLFRHSVSWFIGCGCSYLVLGIAPAELISRELQSLSIKVFIWCAVLFAMTLLLGAGFSYMRKMKFQFNVRALLKIIFAFAILVSLRPWIYSVFGYVDQNASKLRIPAKGWEGFSAEVLLANTQLRIGTWEWANIQWLVHSGPYVAAMVSLVITMVWYAICQARSCDEGTLDYWSQHQMRRWPLLIGSVTTSTAVAAIVGLTLYVWSVPTVIQAAEADFQYKMRYCREPAAHCQQIFAACDAIRSSDNEMSAIVESVEMGIASESR